LSAEMHNNHRFMWISKALALAMVG
jgi:hypothetical protein